LILFHWNIKIKRIDVVRTAFPANSHGSFAHCHADCLKVNLAIDPQAKQIPSVLHAFHFPFFQKMNGQYPRRALAPVRVGVID